MSDFRIGDRLIGGGAAVYIIAEIGINHNGRLDIARQLIDVAVEAGADAVKFQRRSLPHVYQEQLLANPNLGEQAFQYLIPLLKEIELSEEQFHALTTHARNKQIEFLCTPFDPPSADFLEVLGVRAYKIASADLTNLELLEHVAAKGKPMILSTGMSTDEEVCATVQALQSMKAQFALLHCNSTYPAPFETVNLRYLERLKRFGVPVGYSGHERGIAIATAAVALGACIVERHITLDRTLPGPDHAASLEPQGFAKQVRDIRNLQAAMGDGIKRMNQGEVLNRELLGKSLVAAVRIPKGTSITKAMVTAKSPGKYLSVQRRDELLGRQAIRELHPDEPFTEEDLGVPAPATVSTRLTVRWGFKARFHDLDALMRYRPRVVELHLTDEDLNQPFTPPRRYDQELFLHAPDYAFRSLVNLCSEHASQRDASIAIIQRTIDRAKELARHFQGRPTIIVHVGGMSLEPLADAQPLLARLRESLGQLQRDGVEVLLENLPPRPWYFGGQYVSNVFMDAHEVVKVCGELGFGACFDVSHAQLYCNMTGQTLRAYIEVIRPLTKHLHLADAHGIDGEGLQIHDGEVDFQEVLAAFRGRDVSLVPEIWRGHQRGGEGFLIALERLAQYLNEPT